MGACVGEWVRACVRARACMRVYQVGTRCVYYMPDQMLVSHRVRVKIEVEAEVKARDHKVGRALCILSKTSKKIVIVKHFNFSINMLNEITNAPGGPDSLDPQLVPLGRPLVVAHNLIGEVWQGCDAGGDGGTDHNAAERGRGRVEAIILIYI